MDRTYQDRMERARAPRVRWPVVLPEPEPMRCPSCEHGKLLCVRTRRLSEHAVKRERVCGRCGVMVETAASE